MDFSPNFGCYEKIQWVVLLKQQILTFHFSKSWKKIQVQSIGRFGASYTFCIASSLHWLCATETEYNWIPYKEYSPGDHEVKCEHLLGLVLLILRCCSNRPLPEGKKTLFSHNRRQKETEAERGKPQAFIMVSILHRRKRILWPNSMFLVLLL